MRITGGKARGVPLTAPKGDHTRPATDRMREAVFSSLGPRIEGSRVADLFAGTGAYGLEALSRGAAAVSFYETDRHALQCLRNNLQAVVRSAAIPLSVGTVHPQDIYSIQRAPQPFDFIFIDPPYDCIADALPRIFSTAVTAMASPESRIVLELPGNLDPIVPGWQLVRRIGKSGKDKPTAAIFERASGALESPTGSPIADAG